MLYIKSIIFFKSSYAQDIPRPNESSLWGGPGIDILKSGSKPNSQQIWVIWQGKSNYELSILQYQESSLIKNLLFLKKKISLTRTKISIYLYEKNYRDILLFITSKKCSGRRVKLDQYLQFYIKHIIIENLNS